MKTSFDCAQDRRRGVALVMVLAASLLVSSLALLALRSAVSHARLVADARWRIEATLIASAALADTRVAHRGELDTISDGASWTTPAVVRPDGWSWRAEAARQGVVIRLAVTVGRLAADGTRFAGRHASLLLVRDLADTVRVLARQARF